MARATHSFFASFPGRCVERTLELRPFDCALALASRSFVALLPLGVVAQSLGPGAGHGGFAQAIIDRFGLQGAAADAVRQLFATPENVRSGTTVLDLAVAIALLAPLRHAITNHTGANLAVIAATVGAVAAERWAPPLAVVEDPASSDLKAPTR